MSIEVTARFPKNNASGSEIWTVAGGEIDICVVLRGDQNFQSGIGFCVTIDGQWRLVSFAKPDEAIVQGKLDDFVGRRWHSIKLTV